MNKKIREVTQREYEEKYKTIYDVTASEDYSRYEEKAMLRIVEAEKQFPEIVAEARKLIDALGSGGFWKGYYLALDEAITALRNARSFVIQEQYEESKGGN